MKHIALVWTFAAALAAQGQGAQDPKGELAAVIAVEEQERDLGKAETIYRELLAGTKLSAEARATANQRLGRMLQKLGRAEEAKPFLVAGKGEPIGFDDFGPGPRQDVEREKALREKARELVQQILPQVGSNWEPPLYGIVDTRLAEQLLWIGEAAVPEVIAALQAEVGKSSNANRRSAVQGLAGFLWWTGGTLSAAFLASCAKVEDANYRAAIVSTAFQAQHPAMLAEAVRFLSDPDPRGEVVRNLLESGGRSPGLPLGRRLDPAQIVEAALRGPSPAKTRLLQWASRGITLDAATLARVHALVREGLQSTDPEFGNASNQFLLSTASQASIEGLLLLLQELPKMKGQNSVPNSMPQPSPQMPGRTGAESRFTAEQATTLLPALDACARTLGEASVEGTPAGGSRRQWLQQLMWHVAAAGDASVVPTVLQWMDLGYNTWYALVGRVTTANSKNVFARFDRIPKSNDQLQLLGLLANVDLPADLFPALRTKADQPSAGSTDIVNVFGAVMAKTGNPEAADWILAAWQREPQRQGLGKSLIELGRRTQAENVRAAMRTMASANGTQPDVSGELLLALLAWHDEPALDLVVKLNGYPMRAQQPYATKAEPFVGEPLHYLVYQNPDPPHGFTEDEVIGVLRKIAGRASRIPHDWQPKFWSHTAIPDRLLGEFASLVAVAQPRNSEERSGWANWITLVFERERRGSSALAGWTGRMLRHESPTARRAVLAAMSSEDVMRVQAMVESRVDDPVKEVRDEAVLRLNLAGCLQDSKWLARLLAHADPDMHSWAINAIAARLGEPAAAAVLPFAKSPSAKVRAGAAEFLGSIVCKEAVPDLIALLRDVDENVRTAAADALTRIRFFHEQQAHWDRVLKGLDASPASAAEKLLLQAKPDAPKAQRLLAITSLGTLGAPEALPFLIDWTTDTDAEIAAAAKAAITQIHLNPRR